MSFADFRDAFADVMDPEFYPIQYLDDAIANGWIALLEEDQSAVCVEIKYYPSGRKDVHGLVAVGDMDVIINTLIPRAEQWGRERGCTGAIIESREGWLRALKPYGYDMHQVAIRKAL